MSQLQKLLDDAVGEAKRSGYVAAVGSLHNAIHKTPDDCPLCARGWQLDTDNMIKNVAKLIDELKGNGNE